MPHVYDPDESGEEGDQGYRVPPAMSEQQQRRHAAAEQEAKKKAKEEEEEESPSEISEAGGGEQGEISLGEGKGTITYGEIDGVLRRAIMELEHDDFLPEGSTAKATGTKKKREKPLKRGSGRARADDDVASEEGLSQHTEVTLAALAKRHK
jgi:hypothetical protein